MLLPDARLHHNPDPGHLMRCLRAAGIKRAEFARICGVAYLTVRRWFTGEVQIPYSAQFTLESLAIYNQEAKASKCYT